MVQHKLIFADNSNVYDRMKMYSFGDNTIIKTEYDGSSKIYEIKNDFCSLLYIGDHMTTIMQNSGICCYRIN